MSNHPLSADQRAQFIADARAKHYEVTGQLGKGGMGTVFAARDMHLDRGGRPEGDSAALDVSAASKEAIYR